MIRILTESKNRAHKYIAELRDVNVQQDRLRFRLNLRRLANIFAYEISKTLDYEESEVETPLGIANIQKQTDDIVSATILRAGLPMHEGILEVFDDADSAFVTAYRKHHKDGTFEIHMPYVTCPNIDRKVLILTDPMLATGASIVDSLAALSEYGVAKEIHIVVAIASRNGVEYVRRKYPKVNLWIGAVDEELTAKNYIVPGLGDAGDLAFGTKLHD